MLRLTCLAALVALVACSSGIDGGPDCGDALCDNVSPAAICAVATESGTLDMELQYLPQVIACENPHGGPAALRAMAIASRSFAYHVLDWKKSLSDSEWDQVFGCGFKPNQDIIDAVEATSGQVLMHHGEVIAGMHAAGALQTPPSCVGGTTGPFAASTEYRITYNEGRSGNDVLKSPLGSKSSSSNRGAMSQNGANCLAEAIPQQYPQMNTEDVTLKILRFYYGEDIEVVRATGECVLDSATPAESVGIGDSCDTDIQCAEAVGDIAANCEMWFLTATDTLHGYCSIGCFGDCPSGTACINFDSGPGCAPTPSYRNGNCSDLDGTTVRILETVGLATDFEPVCAPPDMGTTCRAPDGSGGQAKGECIDQTLTACPGQLHTGYCPGASNIRCCTL